MDAVALTVGGNAAAAVDAERARFPHCVVWTPLPIVSWLSPLIGHVGICRADGVILDFAGPFFVNVDGFAFGSPAKFLRLDPDQCCFPAFALSGHRCREAFRHSQLGTASDWDDALRSCMHKFQHKTYNFFTCNCHSFVSTCLNRAAYQGRTDWNMIHIVALVHCRGHWIGPAALLRSLAPFVLVLCIGLLTAGWPFLVGWALISSLLAAWFVFATCCARGVADC
ncbi:hypothetical protein SELMODRAFT_95873 [Selaginella moellendorffii]|uniref:PPPDE domain-containing protein n=1 Tax=Selaginella moellendorffii TaxID=88036 RepID=D8RKE5_SELML|nr:hypothetical protein SELMODRAFT_95873 [Selaginella moellendorffii]